MKIATWTVREHRGGVPDVERIYQKVVRDAEINLADDEMLLRTLYVSVDPYLHGLALQTPLGDYMIADSIMEVLEAGPIAVFQPGDLVQGYGGWRTHVISTGRPEPWANGGFPMMFPAYRPLNKAHFDADLPVTTSLGVLGGPGLTAWGVVRRFLDIEPGQTVVISGATGSVGSLVGQLAKRAGARVIGTTSSPTKVDYLTSLGFDEVIGYRLGDDLDSVREELARVAPEGVDRYFDNLGGSITDAVFTMLNVYSRVAVNWQWSTQVEEDSTGPRLLQSIMFPRTTVRGIFASEWATEENWEALHHDIGGMIRRKEITWNETVHHGFDAIPQVYRSLYQTDGTANRGKVIVKL